VIWFLAITSNQAESSSGKEVGRRKRAEGAPNKDEEKGRHHQQKIRKERIWIQDIESIIRCIRGCPQPAPYTIAAECVRPY
jgi:hypothetical protein